MERQNGKSAHDVTPAYPAADEMLRLYCAWREALDKPCREQRKFAGIVTNKEKYLTRAVGYLRRFILALSMGTAPGEARILAAEGCLWPLSAEGCCEAKLLFERVLTESLTVDDCLPLRTAFCIYWEHERCRVARENRAKFNPEKYYAEKHAQFAKAEEIRRLASLKPNRVLRKCLSGADRLS